MASAQSRYCIALDPAFRLGGFLFRLISDSFCIFKLDFFEIRDVLFAVFMRFLLLCSSVNSLVGLFSEVVYIMFLVLFMIGDICSLLDDILCMLILSLISVMFLLLNAVILRCSLSLIKALNPASSSFVSCIDEVMLSLSF